MFSWRPPVWRGDLAIERQERAQATRRWPTWRAPCQALQRAIELALSANNALVAMFGKPGQVTQFEEIGTRCCRSTLASPPWGFAPRGDPPRSAAQGQRKLHRIRSDHDTRQGPESARARESGRLTLAGPMELVQGGLGVVGRQPVYLDDALGQRVFWGFTYVTIRLPEVLAAARLPQLTVRGYHYRLWRVRPDTGEQQTISASTPPPGAERREPAVDLPNGQWTLSLMPINGWGDPGVLAMRCGLGLMFALMMTYRPRLLFELKAHERGCYRSPSAHPRSGYTGAIARHHRCDPGPLFELDQDGRYCTSTASGRTAVGAGRHHGRAQRDGGDARPAAMSVMECLPKPTRRWSTDGRSCWTCPAWAHLVRTSAARRQRLLAASRGSSFCRATSRSVSGPRNSCCSPPGCSTRVAKPSCC